MPALSVFQRNRLLEKSGEQSNLLDSPQLREFFDLFLVCETTARKLIEYQKPKKHKPAKSGSAVKFDSYTIAQVRSAINHFGLQIPNDVVQRVFRSGKSPANSNTCRFLRNGYLHDVPKGKAEIESRFAALKADMVQWINLFV